MQVNIIVYNMMIPVLPPVSCIRVNSKGRNESVLLLNNVRHQSGEDIDVVVVNEIIPGPIESIGRDKLKNIGFTYYTTQMQDILTENGGILIYSKHEIIQTQHTLYGSDCTGSDCLAAKGIVYTRIKKK